MKETFIKKLSLILEDFDSNKNADMENYINDIYLISEQYFLGVIKEERKKAVQAFLIEQLNSRNKLK